MRIKRIIPCLDLKNGRVVKGVKFENLVDAGDPAEIAARYSCMNADELVFLDISATTEGRKIMLDVIRQAAARINIPLTVGGGIRSAEDIEAVLNAGADKVSISSQAVKTPEFIMQAAHKFGSDRIVVAIDAKKNNKGGYDVYRSGGKINTNLDAVDWARIAAKLGAGEILLTSMDADGTKTGYDIELVKCVSEAVNIPVIASGGAGKLEHFAEALTDGGADAVLAASLFHFGEIEIGALKDYLADKGIPVRRN